MNKRWARLSRCLRKWTRATSSTSMDRAATTRWARKKFKLSYSNCSIAMRATIWINRRTTIKWERSSASPLQTFSSIESVLLLKGEILR